MLSALMQVAIRFADDLVLSPGERARAMGQHGGASADGILMPASMLAVAFSYVAIWMAAPFALAARWSLQGILLAVHWSGGAQLPDLRVAMPALAAMAAVVVCYGLALLLARRHRLLALASLALLAASAWLVFAYPRPFEHNPHELEITAIDIGQGDSFLVVTPGGHTLLLDSGGLLGMSHSDLDIGEDVVSPYLWQRGLRPSGRGRLQPQPLRPHRRDDGDSAQFPSPRTLVRAQLSLARGGIAICGRRPAACRGASSGTTEKSSTSMAFTSRCWRRRRIGS